MLPEKIPDKQTIEKRLQEVPGFSSKCFELFRQWTAKASRQFPNWEPDIMHEQEILDEVKDCFFKGVKASYKEDKKHAPPGYFTGFLAGFVQGSVATAWSVRYLPKPGIYKEVLWLKSIRRYLGLPIEAAEHVNRIFTALDQRNILSKTEAGDEITQEDIAMYHVFADINFEENRQAMQAFLEKLELKHIHKFIDKMPKIALEEIEHIFDWSDIEFILFGKKH